LNSNEHSSGLAGLTLEDAKQIGKQNKIFGKNNKKNRKIANDSSCNLFYGCLFLSVKLYFQT
jgi:hypothetical protein